MEVSRTELFRCNDELAMKCHAHLDESGARAYLDMTSCNALLVDNCSDSRTPQRPSFSPWSKCRAGRGKSCLLAEVGPSAARTSARTGYVYRHAPNVHPGSIYPDIGWRGSLAFYHASFRAPLGPRRSSREHANDFDAS